MSTLATKLQPPLQPRGLLSRRSLALELERNLDKKLLLVTAPAGYGKSTTLSQLFVTLGARSRHMAWLSLDADDNDAVRLAAHLCEAICLTGLLPGHGGLFHDALASLHGPNSTPSADALKTEVLNALALLREDLYLFLDDFHLVGERASTDLVCAILTAPLPRLHVVMASRAQPNLPLARLRAAGQVHEIEAGRLAFSTEETHAFMKLSAGMELAPALAQRLCARTEGWAASLQMVAIAMHSAESIDAFLDGLTGADRSIADFLLEEVLQRQTAAVQRFLLATSILRRFNSALANALLEQGDSHALMEQVESSNLFMLSLDRERNWFRYHHLFAEFLRKRLADRHPELAAECHRRACEWLARHDLPTDAIEHAFALGDDDRAGELLDTASPALLSSGQTATLQAYARRLPPRILARLPRLQLELAWENIIRWRFDEARAALRGIAGLLADRQGADNPLDEDELDVLQAGLAHRQLMLDVFTDQLESARAGARAWVAQRPTHDGFMNASVQVVLLLCERERYVCDLTRSEWTQLREQFMAARAAYGTVFLDTVVGSTLHARGDLAAAEETLVLACETAVRIQGDLSMLAAMPQAQLAQLMYETNRLAQAEQLLDLSCNLPPDFGLVDSLMARQITTARLARQKGTPLAAHRALDVASRLADRYALARLHAHVLDERVHLLLGEGDLTEARRLLQEARHRGMPGAAVPSGVDDTHREQFAKATARVALEQGNHAEAIACLRRWLTWSNSHRCARASIRLGVLMARLQARAGDRLAARRSLIQALKLGHAGGFVRSFLDEGAELAQLLEDLMATAPETLETTAHGYARQLLAAYGQGVTPAPKPKVVSEIAQADAGLSARALEIMRLTAGNMTSSEVAAALGLTESTVKWYWQNIFEALGVRRRNVALRVARQRGLIS